MWHSTKAALSEHGYNFVSARTLASLTAFPLCPVIDLDHRWAENGAEKSGKEKQDHRDGQGGRQGRRLFLRRGHSLIATFLRQYAQRRTQRRAVLLGLDEHGRQLLDGVDPGAGVEVFKCGASLFEEQVAKLFEFLHKSSRNI
jgi:hypothetical protein